MTYENKALGRTGLEFGAPVTGSITVVGRKEHPDAIHSSVLAGDELVATACVYGALHYGKDQKREVFMPGCFARTLATEQAVRLILDHDESKLIATRADSMSIDSDDEKLSLRCKIPNNQAGRELKATVTDGERTECSVGYLVFESFEREVRGESVKFIVDAKLLEVSIVRKGAVPGTKASIRSSTDDGLVQSLNELGDALDRKDRALRLLLDSLR